MVTTDDSYSRWLGRARCVACASGARVLCLVQESARRESELGKS